jgi:hypothetical protein
MCEEFADTKGVIRIRKSKKNRQRNGQNKKDNRTSSDLQNTTQKTMPSDMFYLTEALPGLFLFHDLSPAL